MRHGLAVSAACLVIALFSGIGGYAFAEEPTIDYLRAADAPPRERSPFGVLTRLVGLADAPTPAPQAASRGPEPESTPGLDAAAAATEQPTRATAVVAAPVRNQALAFSNAAPQLRPGDRIAARVTFYYCEEAAGGGFPQGDGGGFCGRMRDGSVVRSGAAACDVAYLGQRFRIEGDPTGRTYVCADTGSAIHGPNRDIWFLDNREGWQWQRSVGTSAIIEVVP